MSEKWIIYRLSKYQKKVKQLRVRTKLSVDARTLETLTSPLRSTVRSFVLFI